ncbi:MAG: alpha/beta fold hydrolase, partial [Flavobacteriales bacterium]
MKNKLFKRLYILLAFLGALISLQSCNILKIVDHRQVAKFNKNGLQAYSFQDADGTIRYAHYSQSNKPKIMLLHGYGASGIGQYYRTVLNLKDEFDFILPDLIYCGHSTGNGQQYSIDDQVEHLHKILDSLHCDENFVLMGNSYGGIVASYFAEKYPDRVKKLVIYDSPVNFYTLKYADSLAHSLGVESVRNLLSPLNVRENKIAFDLVFHDQPYVPRFLRRQMIKYGTLPVRDNQIKLLENLIQQEKAMNDHTFRWKMPVYLAWGEFDRLIPMSTCTQIAEKYDIP